MEAKELRIGNYIMFSDNNGISYRKISCIKINEFGFYSDIDGVNLGICKPIPLTEEWLLKFGFVESQDIDTIFGLKLNDFWYINEFQIRNKFNAILLEVELKYVHQLQNLYFALTNEELTLK